jgi:hypothetical protein
MWGSTNQVNHFVQATRGGARQLMQKWNDKPVGDHIDRQTQTSDTRP